MAVPVPYPLILAKQRPESSSAHLLKSENTLTLQPDHTMKTEGNSQKERLFMYTYSTPENNSDQVYTNFQSNHSSS
jgi:hypothetical protein